VYESCFGDDVVREVREEMRAAAARCTAAASAGSASPQPPAHAVFEHLENTVPQTTTRVPTSTSTPAPVTTSTSRPQQDATKRPFTPASVANIGSETLVRLQALLSGLKNVSDANHFGFKAAQNSFERGY